MKIISNDTSMVNTKRHVASFGVSLIVYHWGVAKIVSELPADRADFIVVNCAVKPHYSTQRSLAPGRAAKRFYFYATQFVFGKVFLHSTFTPITFNVLLDRRQRILSTSFQSQAKSKLV